MKNIILILFFLVGQLIFGQVNYHEIDIKVKSDFKTENYTFHSLEVLPIENTYHFVLRKDYKINWRFISQDSLDYYNSYDSILKNSLKQKFGNNFLKKAIIKSDSLENTENWRKEAQYPGGKIEMVKFINDKSLLISEFTKERTDEKIAVIFTINENGKIKDIKTSLNKDNKINEEIIRVFKEMPNWKPKYLYGKPVTSRYSYPIILK